MALKLLLSVFEFTGKFAVLVAVTAACLVIAGFITLGGLWLALALLT